MAAIYLALPGWIITNSISAGFLTISIVPDTPKLGENNNATYRNCPPVYAVCLVRGLCTLCRLFRTYGKGF